MLTESPGVFSWGGKWILLDIRTHSLEFSWWFDSWHSMTQPFLHHRCSCRPATCVREQQKTLIGVKYLGYPWNSMDILSLIYGLYSFCLGEPWWTNRIWPWNHGLHGLLRSQWLPMTIGERAHASNSEASWRTPISQISFSIYFYFQDLIGKARPWPLQGSTNTCVILVPALDNR